MKLLAYMLLGIILPFCALAQNHVPNGNFEQYNSCPTADGQIIRCAGWSSFISTNSSPDFYHTCGATGFQIPFLTTGYQQAASGNGFAATITIATNSTSPVTPSTNYREVITRQIIPLAVNTYYEVSFSVSRANNFGLGSDNMSVFFFDTIGNITLNNLQNVVPQITFQQLGVISDTANWVRLKGYFLADSAYDNIAIGGFLNTNNVDIDTFPSSFPHGYAYYYLDSVVVKPVYMQLSPYPDTIVCVGDTININYVTSTNYNSNNTFTAQLSDKFGSFTNPITLGTKSSDTSGTIICTVPNSMSTGSNYKIRIISSSPADTIIDTLHTLDIGNLDSANIGFYNLLHPCEGSTYYFFNNTTNSSNITYSWTGPNNFSSSSGAPIIPGITLSHSGNYIVTSQLFGCIQRDTLPVQVYAVAAHPTITAISPLCEHQTLNLTANSSTSGVSYHWIGPNNFSSNSQNVSIPNVSSANAGVYKVHTIYNNCGIVDSITINVSPAPDSVNVSSNSPLCTGDTLQLISDTSTGNVSYTWKGPNSFSANTVTTSINNTTTNTTGWYSMTVDLNGCSYIDSTYVLVNQKPIQPSISFNTPLCAGETLNLAASGSSNYSYQWYGPSTFSANAKNTTRSNVQTNYSGVYKVTTIENGCVSDTGFASITINPLPFAVITSNPTDSICVGQLASFTALPGNAGSSPQYNWYVNTQLVASGISYNTTTLNNQDVVYCEMTDNTKCSVPYTDQSNFLTMTVLPWLAPSVTITVSPTGPVQSGTFLTFTATATNAGNNPQYQWKRNGKDIVGATGSSWGALSLNNNDTITVEIISDYRCPQPTNAVSNKIVTQIEGVGINEIAGLTNLTLAPNPNRGQFILSGQFNYNGMVHISVMNMLGQTIYRTDSEVINNQLHQQIVLPQVASGMYLLQLEAEGQRMNRKFRVE